MVKKIWHVVFVFCLLIGIVIGVILYKVSMQQKNGDINNDGCVDIVDCSMLRLDIVDAQRLRIEQAQRADINNDGYADDKDYEVIRETVLLP